MSKSNTSSSSEANQPLSSSSVFSQPWATTWRKALVSIPRLVPDITLRLTSPEGPQPVVAKLPSRGSHKIPVYIFIPPSITAAAISTDQKTQSNQPPIPCPVLLDFHGGSFVLGSCQEQAPFCARLCRELDCVAISVDYRLGPAAQFPAALEDAEDVLNAILDPSKPGYNTLRLAIDTSIPLPPKPTDHHSSSSSNRRPTKPRISLDTSRLAISGFSSGGNIACNLALSIEKTPPLLMSDWPTPLPRSLTHPIPLLLFFPSLDARLLPHERPLPPGLDPPKGFFASLDLEKQLMPTYLPRHLATHPRASPGLVSLVNNEALHPSVRILMVLPELDALTAPSTAWVERVRTETNRSADVELLVVPRMLHGWTQFPDGWLDEDARTKKKEVFDRAVGFVGGYWSRR